MFTRVVVVASPSRVVAMSCARAAVGASLIATKAMAPHPAVTRRNLSAYRPADVFGRQALIPSTVRLRDEPLAFRLEVAVEVAGFIGICSSRIGADEGVCRRGRCSAPPFSTSRVESRIMGAGRRPGEPPFASAPSGTR